jgi:hypothetical protein
MKYSLAGQYLTAAIVFGIFLSLVYDQVRVFLAKRKIRGELRKLLETSNESWWVEHRAFLERKRTGREIRLSKDALIDVVAEECREWEGDAFSLDAPDEAA